MFNFLLGANDLSVIVEGLVAAEVNNMVWEETLLEELEQLAWSINDAVGEEIDEGV